MATEKARPLKISYCVKCDVSIRDQSNTNLFIEHLKSLLEVGYVKQLTWGNCRNHKTVEKGTEVTAYLVWEDIIKQR
jgi:hypothetical protein